MITVTAGSEKATIDVTQAAAGKEQYPDTEAKLKQAIAKVWTFAESSNYVSLEFTTDGLYTFLSKTPFTRAAENNIYLLSGAYSVAADLHELTLSDFGKITISDVGNGKASMTIAPTGGTPSTAELDEQRFVTPRRRRIRRSKGSSRKNLRRETAPSNTVTMRIGGCRRLRFHRAA